MDVVYTLATLIMWYRQHLESKKLTELLKKNAGWRICGHLSKSVEEISLLFPNITKAV